MIILLGLILLTFSVLVFRGSYQCIWYKNDYDDDISRKIAGILLGMIGIACTIASFCMISGRFHN